MINVDNSEVLQQGIVKVGMQGLTLRLIDGPYKGQEVEALNQLIGKMELDKIFAKGDIALVVFAYIDYMSYKVSMQKKCKSCNSTIEPEDVFCPYCGLKIEF